MTIAKDVNLVGESQDGTIIDGTNNGRPVTINGGTVDLTRFTIKNGKVIWESGGGIINYGTLNINECTITSNTTSIGGG